MQQMSFHLAVLAMLALPSAALAQTHVFHIALDGSQEVPQNNSNGTGLATVRLDQGTGAVSVTGTYANLGSARSAQHIHAAPAGTNGGVVIPLSGTGGTSGTISGGGTLTATDVQTMLDGGMYVNVHSSGFPGGEIRGQIIATTLYYKFDRGIGSVAVNYGSFATSGTVTSGTTPTSPWVAGRTGFGNALQGSTPGNTTSFSYCDTGWNGNINGDVTISWWMKERQAPGTSANYLFGGLGSFRCFTGGVAGTGLYIRATNTNNQDLVLSTDIKTPAARAQGVCIAVVASGLSAQYYIDGVAAGSPITLTAPFAVPTNAGTFKIGKHATDSTASAYDIDEFRFVNFAATPAQLQQWCTAPSAASGAFGTTCGIIHGTTGGPPKIGSTTYAQTIEATPPAVTGCLFVVGATPTLPFDMGIAFPALAGCDWYTAFHAEIVVTTAADGTLTIPTGVPNMPALAGVLVDTQVLGFQGGTPLQSNAMSHAIEVN